MVRPSFKQRQSSSPHYILLFFIMNGLCYLLGRLHNNLTSEPFGTILKCDNAISPGPSGRDYGNGWHSIEVFYGKSDQFETTLPKNLEWFSQARQDEIVSSLFRGKRNGFFVDLAANDATHFSNSYSLEKKFGWNGLCIEPNPMYWSNQAYRDCQVVAAIVGKERMEEVRFRFNHVYGGIAGKGFDNGEKEKDASDLKYTVSLKEILERFNAPKQIDYLSLDVEGAESLVMNEFPFADYTISLLTIERPKSDLRELLLLKGFKYLKELSIWGETLWAHESIVNSLDQTILDSLILGTRAPTRPEPATQAPTGS